MNRKKYQRLSSEYLEVIKKLTKRGESLNHIAKITGLGKTTIYYQTRKFKPKLKKDFIVQLNNFQIGELIGAFAGDGSYYHKKRNPPLKSSYHHRVRFHLSFKSDKKYGKYLFRLLKGCNLNPFYIIKPESGRLDLSISSKEFIEFIKNFIIWDDNKTYSIRLKSKLTDYPPEFIMGFARGLMDTDGYVEISNVSCACISKRLIKNLTEIFDLFNIKYKLSIRIRAGRKKLYLVRVYRESLEGYLKIIGFSNDYKLIAINKIINKNSKD